MKYIIGLLIIITLGCAPLSDVRERDIKIQEMEQRIASDSLLINELGICTEELSTLNNKYKTAAIWKDQWFKEYNQCSRQLDTLLLYQTEIESKAGYNNSDTTQFK
jgi:hypothetical protein